VKPRSPFGAELRKETERLFIERAA
jgi:hypothetical protein